MGFLSQFDWVSLFSIFVGATIGSFFTWMVTRGSEKRTLKKNIEIETAKDIISDIRLISNSYSLVSSKLYSIKYYALQFDEMEEFDYLKERLKESYKVYQSDYSLFKEKLMNFLFGLDEKRIVVQKFWSMREFICENKSAIDFKNARLLHKKHEWLLIPDGESLESISEDIIKISDELNSDLLDLLYYLNDFSTEIQNEFLSELFKPKLERRKPENERHIVLSIDMNNRSKKEKKKEGRVKTNGIT